MSGEDVMTCSSSRVLSLAVWNSWLLLMDMDALIEGYNRHRSANYELGFSSSAGRTTQELAQSV